MRSRQLVGKNRITMTETGSIVINTEERIGAKLAPFNPTSITAIHIALDMISTVRPVDENDVLYDLGCGDGRFLSEALNKYTFLKGIGIEYDLSLVDRAKTLCKCHERIEIIHGNVLEQVI